MADKRLYQLSTAAATSGKFILLDKSGQSEAEKYSFDLVATKGYVDNQINTNVKVESILNDTGAQTITVSSDYLIEGVIVEMTSGTSATAKAGWTVGGEDVFRPKTVYDTTPRGYDLLVPVSGTTLYVTITGYVNFFVLMRKFR